jgi:hypothetical protein
MKIFRKLAVPLVALVVLLYLRSSERIDPAEHDRWCEQLMAKGKSAEARAWFEEGDAKGELRTVYEFDNVRTHTIIQELYDLGAAKVTATDIDSEPGFGETTDVLIVALPQDAEHRAKLFRYENRHSGFFGLGGVSDQGQKYLFLWWD